MDTEIQEWYCDCEDDPLMDTEIQKWYCDCEEGDHHSNAENREIVSDYKTYRLCRARDMMENTIVLTFQEFASRRKYADLQKIISDYEYYRLCLAFGHKKTIVLTFKEFALRRMTAEREYEESLKKN